jgi:hypothetical protein
VDGGYMGATNTYSNATWTYHLGKWTNITAVTSNAPPIRVACGLTYDASAGYLVMFGGSTPSPNYTYYNDIWSFK